MTIHVERIKYGVLEENHMSGARTGRIWGQLPAAADITVLENGQFAKYDVANGEVNFTGNGAWYIVSNEEKHYDEREKMHRDFALRVEDFYDGKMYPRLKGLEEGDTFTTNTVVPGDYTLGDQLHVNAQGFLEAGEAPAGEHKFQVVKEYVLPDGQPALKIRVIA